MAPQKQRYAYLDGIRGVAALFVILRHTTEFWTFSVYRSYLAVDIFFVLSGFVIANAYGKKMASGAMSLKGFVLVRLIRLYPVYFFSLCLSIPIYLYELAARGTPMALPETVPVVVLSLLFLPGVMIPNGLLFPINGPYWSLFFELIANFLYGIARPVLSSRVLVWVVVTLGVLLLGMSGYHGCVDFGFLFQTRAVVAGLTRASFGIFFGILIHSRMQQWTIRYRPWLAITMMCVVFMIPSFGRYDFIIDLLALYFIFPACVVLAATNKSDTSTRVMLFLGSASYPMYVLHEPFGKLVLIATDGYAATIAPYSGWLLMAAVVVLSSLLESKIDEPVRKRLSRWILHKRPPAPSVTPSGIGA